MTSLTVYYDGSCPLCRREIDYYRARAEDVEFLDVSTTCSVLGDDLNCDEALRRFHVRDAAGTLFSGAGAFAQLWLRTPSLRWAGAIFSRQPFRAVADVAYHAFLTVRPVIQSGARRILKDES
ncbi:MAG: DUF393 domain-containing protein [Pseudomonadota bacterium]